MTLLSRTLILLATGDAERGPHASAQPPVEARRAEAAGGGPVASTAVGSRSGPFASRLSALPSPTQRGWVPGLGRRTRGRSASVRQNNL